MDRACNHLRGLKYCCNSVTSEKISKSLIFTFCWTNHASLASLCFIRDCLEFILSETCSKSD